MGRDRKGAIACVEIQVFPISFLFSPRYKSCVFRRPTLKTVAPTTFVRKLMALPFLPGQKIKIRFLGLQEKATTEALKTFTAYIEKTWITGDTFPPTTWSVYMQAKQTNNDLEGWHNDLNRRAKGKAQLPLYVLIQLLHKKASLVAIQIQLVSGKRLQRHQRKTYKKLQTRLFKLWHQYENDERNSKQLLEACSHLVQISFSFTLLGATTS